jgi:hypothetical protein
LAYAKLGTITGACAVTPSIYGNGRLSRDTVTHWIKEDSTFQEGWTLAKETFADSLEEIAYERLASPQGNRGSDWLLVKALGVLRPKWDKPVIQDSGTADVLTLLRSEARRLMTSADGSTVEETISIEASAARFPGVEPEE